MLTTKWIYWDLHLCYFAALVIVTYLNVHNISAYLLHKWKYTVTSVFPFSGEPVSWIGLSSTNCRIQKENTCNELFYELFIKQVFWKTKSFKKQVFQIKVLGLRAQHFPKKIPFQSPKLWQIEWRVKTEPITKNRVFPLAALIFVE